MASPGRWSPVPRGTGPEFLACWFNRSGYWRLAVYRRDWSETESVYTNVPSDGPRPGDTWLGKLGFAPAGDSEWAWNGDYGCWERPAGRVPK